MASGGGAGRLEVAMETICVFSRSMPHTMSLKYCGALRIVNGGIKHEKIKSQKSDSHFANAAA